MPTSTSFSSTLQSKKNEYLDTYIEDDTTGQEDKPKPSLSNLLGIIHLALLHGVHIFAFCRMICILQVWTLFGANGHIHIHVHHTLPCPRTLRNIAFQLLSSCDEKRRRKEQKNTIDELSLFPAEAWLTVWAPSFKKTFVFSTFWTVPEISLSHMGYATIRIRDFAHWTSSNHQNPWQQRSQRHEKKKLLSQWRYIGALSVCVETAKVEDEPVSVWLTPRSQYSNTMRSSYVHLKMVLLFGCHIRMKFWICF